MQIKKKKPKGLPFMKRMFHKLNDGSKKGDKSIIGFTLIELIVVMAVIAILTLLAAPKFMGYTQTARHTKLISTSRELERASERYFMDAEDWPRLTDDPYTADEIHAFAERIYDATGKEVSLDPDGHYYDIDYDKLSQYVKVPDDKMNYVLRNPVGKVYALEGLTEPAKERTTQIKPTDITFTVPNLSIIVGKSAKLELNFTPIDTTLREVTFESSNPEIATVDIDGNVTAVSEGTTKVTVTSWDKSITKSIDITVALPFIAKDFTYTGAGQTFVVPESGRYMLEVWGAQGAGNAGGKGGYSKGEAQLESGQTLSVLVGGRNGYNGGGSGGYNGGGGTDIRLNGISLQERIIVAGGGGGQSNEAGPSAGGYGGGSNGRDGASRYRGFGCGATQTGGGSSYATYPSHTKGGSGSLGQGGMGSSANTTLGAGGGGGGYYGGGGGSTDSSGNDDGSGGGGSGYIGGVQNGKMLAGNQSMSNHSGGLMTGNAGNGYAVITYIGN